MDDSCKGCPAQSPRLVQEARWRGASSPLDLVLVDLALLLAAYMFDGGRNLFHDDPESPVCLLLACLILALLVF